VFFKSYGSAIRWRSYARETEALAGLTSKMNTYLNSLVKSFALVCLPLLLTRCSTVPDRRLPPPSATNTSPTAADINKALAALAGQSAASSLDYQIGPEDLIEITLFNIPEAIGMERHLTPRTTTVRVSQKGQISLPLLGQIDVMGLSVPALERKLREAYDQYIHRPQVGVLVREFRQRASVIGAVQKPGVVELTGPKTIIDVLAMAGGLSEKASSQVHIYRNTAEGRQSYVIDLLFLTSSGRSTDPVDSALISMPIQVGDIVNVPQAGTVFIDGAVKTPGSFPLPRRYSLTQALTLAGGVDYELANYSGATIFRRRSPGEVETIPANLDDILAGNAADPQIEPDDTIVIPVSSMKFFIKRFVGQIFTPNISPYMFTGS
jgi:polysaccharide export outer membrane protein